MKVVFVCLGNICRSPMGERVAHKMAAERGMNVTFSSAGISDEESGNPMDSRAARLLSQRGYSYEGHCAHKITAEEIYDADLVVAAEPKQVSSLHRMAPGADNIVLLNDYNPALPKGTALADPWYGGEQGFIDTLNYIEQAIDGLLDDLV